MIYRTLRGTKIRRGLASYFSPTQVVGLVAWFKADTILGLLDGAALSRWDNYGGSAVTTSLVQTTASLQPLYKTNVQNGLPGVLFDGSDDEMTTVIAVTGSTVFSMFCVLRDDSVSGETRGALQNGSRWGFLRVGTDQRAVCVVLNPASNGINGSSTSSFELWSLRYNGAADANFFVNGIEEALVGLGATGTVSGDLDVGNVAQSGTNPDNWKGYICEILIYNTPISLLSMHKIHQYLKQKWAL